MTRLLSIILLTLAVDASPVRAGEVADSLVKVCKYFEARAFNDRRTRHPGIYSLRIELADGCRATLLRSALEDSNDPLHSLAVDHAQSLIALNRSMRNSIVVEAESAALNAAPQTMRRVSLISVGPATREEEYNLAVNFGVFAALENLEAAQDRLDR